MPRAEIGSTKHLNNKMKAKGLGRLRWYCQVCERQMRDENGFKCHVQSESHIRQIAIVGEDPKKYIAQYSNDFLKDFVQLLRTAHGTKFVHVNHFYQEYIANKEHIHMNATQWQSLTEFASYLGREGKCRVEEREGKGLFIAWVDNSPEALRRQAAIQKRDRQDKGDEEREQKLIQEQVERAQQETITATPNDDDDDDQRLLQRKEGEKVKLSFGAKAAPVPAAPQTVTPPAEESPLPTAAPTDPPASAPTPAPAAPVKISFGGGSSASKNVFKNPLAGKKGGVKEQPKKMSEMERIMKEEMERKRPRDGAGQPSSKRQKVTISSSTF